MNLKYRWIIEVLEDMSTFAANEGLSVLKEELDKSTQTAVTELSAVAEILDVRADAPYNLKTF